MKQFKEKLDELLVFNNRETQKIIKGDYSFQDVLLIRLMNDNSNKVALLETLEKRDLINMILELHLTIDGIYEETENMLERNGVEDE